MIFTNQLEKLVALGCMAGRLEEGRCALNKTEELDQASPQQATDDYSLG